MAQYGDDEPLLFSTVLRPRRSVGAGALRAVLLAVAVGWLGVGLVFAAVGAWPVSGFMGLEVLLLGGAFWLSHRTGRGFESIDLTEQRLTVRRVGHRGDQRRWSFHPHWLRIAEAPAGVELRSQGRSLIVGAFLAADECRALADSLRQALKGG